MGNAARETRAACERVCSLRTSRTAAGMLDRELSRAWRVIEMVCRHAPMLPLAGVLEAVVEHSVAAGMIRLQATSLRALWKVT